MDSQVAAAWLGGLGTAAAFIATAVQIRRSRRDKILEESRRVEAEARRVEADLQAQARNVVTWHEVLTADSPESGRLEVALANRSELPVYDFHATVVTVSTMPRFQVSVELVVAVGGGSILRPAEVWRRSIGWTGDRPAANEITIQVEFTDARGLRWQSERGSLSLIGEPLQSVWTQEINGRRNGNQTYD